MKRIIALALVLVLALSLVACGGKTSSSNGAKTYKVGVAIYNYNDNFMTLYRNEIEAYFKTLETDTVKYELTMVDSANDMAKQTEQVNQFITQKMDVVILNLVQTSSADSVIKTLVDANIPVVLINREPLGPDGDESYAGILDNAKVCYVGADARQSGVFQGEIVAALADKGDLNGDGKVSYIMIEGDPENPDAQFRTQKSVEALSKVIDVECLDDQIGMWDQTKGQELCANALTKFGDAIEVVFCNNDGMALGASAAIAAAGRTVGKDIYLLGVDALDEAVEKIGNGTMTGTVLNDHIGQSHKAVDVAVELLNGKDIQNYYWVDYVKVDADWVAANK